MELKLGEKQTLRVLKKVDFGVYLGEGKTSVLLPKKETPEGVIVGEQLSVFIYKDSQDRLIATTAEPKLAMGKIAILEVTDVCSIGAFLDWGLEKDLFLPFREQTTKVKKGDRVLVGLYIDKSGRLCATMKVYSMLRTDSPYRKDEWVQGFVYEKSEEFGAFVAVDGIYSALIPKKDVTENLSVGQEVRARVSAIKTDGKLDLSLKEKIPLQTERDCQVLMDLMKKSGGTLPFHDRSNPDQIRETLNMSKSSFKRAVGRLLKTGQIELSEKGIRLK